MIPAPSPMIFKEHVMKFLLTQYGLPSLADNYFKQIYDRIKSYATNQNRYASILWQILDNSFGEVRLIVSQENLQVKYSMH